MRGGESMRLSEYLTSGPLAIGAIVGVFFAITECRASQPRLSIDFLSGEVHEIPINFEKIGSDLENIERLHAQLTEFLIINLIDASRSVDPTVPDEVLAFKMQMDRVVDDFRSRRDSKRDPTTVVAELGVIVIKLNRIVDELDKQIDGGQNAKLYIVVGIENRSRVQTIIRREAIVRVWNDEQSYRDVSLYGCRSQTERFDGSEVA